MQLTVQPASAPEVLPLRTRLRQEHNHQLVHDSIHRREGWTQSYLLASGARPVGFGSIAIGGPWKGKPTIFEFYLLPEHRVRAFAAFAILLAASEARCFEVQTSETLLTALALNALGAIPCARCDPGNVPSRRTLQKAGFIPFAHLLRGAIARR